jgi:hypothetical protein
MLHVAQVRIVRLCASGGAVMRLRFVLLAVLVELLYPNVVRCQDVRGESDTMPVVVRAATESAGPDVAGGTPRAAPTPLAPLPKDAVLRSAYLDAYRILSRDNSCSAFFGGPAPSLVVLNRLVASVRKKVLADEGVGMRMSGEVSYFKDERSGAEYRLFGQMTLNARGIFYRAHLLHAPRLLHDTDLLPPRMRETRVVLLLHELAHLLQGPDGRWLILNDGDDRRQSERNTLTIMQRCGPQVQSLRDGVNGRDSQVAGRR